ncbi:T9SS type A sorting domain-containing protein, partial [bacterium]|nr:T9SS type A sorting domain-containing protein [bacterium]
YPNPFNPSTTIKFALPNNGPANLSVFDLAGRLVKTLVSGNMNASEHTVVWNGDDNSGRKVSSGTYYYRLNAGDFTETRKMSLIK